MENTAFERARQLARLQDTLREASELCSCETRETLREMLEALGRDLEQACSEAEREFRGQ